MLEAFASAAKMSGGQKYGQDVALWAQERAGAYLWSKQREIADALIHNKRVAVRAGHGVGKSYLAAALAGWWVDTHPTDEIMVVTTAPSLDQVHAILWQEIGALHAKAHLPGVVQKTDRWVIGPRLVGMGRKPPDYSESAFQGIHRRYVLVILDEACGIPAHLWTAVETITTGDDCRILAIGNPDDPNSHFRYVCDGRPGWYSTKISVLDSPNFTGEPVPEYLRGLLTSTQWVEDRKAEWGEDNPLYVAKVLGEFPVDNPWSVVRMSDVTACRIAAPRTQREQVPVELGVDVGGGLDETVIRERRGMVAGREWRELSDQPESISRLILRAIRETGATSVKIDAIGVGAGVVGEMRNLRTAGVHHAKIHGVNVAEKAHHPDRYFNLRSEIWWELGRIQSQERDWDLSQMEDADRTIAQMLEVRYEHDLKGRVKIEPKDDVRKRIGRSPDNADALLLAFYSPKAAASEWFDAAMGASRYQVSPGGLLVA
jgi:hypothetical protein